MSKVYYENFTQEEFKSLIKDSLSEVIGSINPNITSESIKPEQLLTRKEVACYLKITLPTLHRIINEGKLDVYYLTETCPRFKYSDIEEFINKNRL
jgi:excisionase family DNA binding protein